MDINRAVVVGAFLFSIALAARSPAQQSPVMVRNLVRNVVQQTPGQRPNSLRRLPPLEAACELADFLDEKAEETKTFGINFARIEYWWDSRAFNVFNFQGGYALPYEFRIWGFVDFEGLDALGANREDTARYFYEVDLSRKVIGDFGPVVEMNDMMGDGNAAGRIGMFYAPSWDWLKEHKTFLWFKSFWGSDESWQFSIAWNKQVQGILDDRISAGGFFDVNVFSDRTVIVSDTQVRLRLVEQFHAVTEFRVNQFLTPGTNYGTAIGFQYRF